MTAAAGMVKLSLQIVLLVLLFPCHSLGQHVSLWNFKELKEAPAFSITALDTGDVRTIIYRGGKFGKKEYTNVFAYYSTPGIVYKNDKLDKKLPAVVLVHGGGGRAFKEWVRIWASRGYAAIAMDLSGNDGSGNRLLKGGPNQDERHKFDVDNDKTEQWVFHSVSNVILAHSLIRSFPAVDSSRTAITGISWGGFLTCIIAGIDPRFKAAVPVYGCGFVNEPGGVFYENYFKNFPPDQTATWMRQYDASAYISKARIPFLWINGARDPYYFPLISSKTHQRLAVEGNYSLLPEMPHGHEAGWAPPEIGAFIDSYLKGTRKLPKVGRPNLSKGRIISKLSMKERYTNASLSYTTDTVLPFSNRTWATIPAFIKRNRIISNLPPENATIWILNVKTLTGFHVSSDYQFVSRDLRKAGD